MTAAEIPDLLVADVTAWHAWLAAHHTEPTGVWLVFGKKGQDAPTTLTYQPALEEALCFGWIDGQSRRGDDTTYSQRFTPRRARSPWSQRNVGIVARLIAQSRMQPAGLAEIERAKGDGRWDAAYAGSAGMEMPADLRDALAASSRASAMFEILTSANRFAICYRLGEAKRPGTRARRLTTYIEMLERGETLHPQKQRLET